MSYCTQVINFFTKKLEIICFVGFQASSPKIININGQLFFKLNIQAKGNKCI